MTEIDRKIIKDYLDNARLHEQVGNEFGYGYWMGRSMSHAEQNAIDSDWLTRQVDKRGLDTAIIEIPKLEVNRG